MACSSGCCSCSNTCRFGVMIFMTSTFFLVEISVGHVVHSLALISDSYHMLSDIVALFIGFASLKMSKRSSIRNTYGWARAEVLGALVNAVFLLVLCFTIFTEAIYRMVETEKIIKPDLMLIVGGLGLLINVIGMIMFGGHGHSHGSGGHGHGHSHGGGGDDHGHSHSDKEHIHEDESKKHGHSHGEGDNHSHTDTSDNCSKPGVEDTDVPVVHVEGKEHGKENSSSQMNMHGVFLHVFSDFLGSVVVCISALLVKYIDNDWVDLVDPIMSVIIVIIIAVPTVPLFRDAAYILLQAIPDFINTSNLQQKLLKEVDGILAVHELHVWQLSGDCLVCSVHVVTSEGKDTMDVGQRIKKFFHGEGIHSTTVQHEIVSKYPSSRPCFLECGPEMSCYKKTCCGRLDKHETYAITNEDIYMTTVTDDKDAEDTSTPSSILHDDTTQSPLADTQTSPVPGGIRGVYKIQRETTHIYELNTESTPVEPGFEIQRETTHIYEFKGDSCADSCADNPGFESDDTHTNVKPISCNTTSECSSDKCHHDHRSIEDADKEIHNICDKDDCRVPGCWTNLQECENNQQHSDVILMEEDANHVISL